MLDPEIRFVHIDGMRLGYRESGNKHGKKLIALHGMAEASAFFWRPLIEHFADRYHIFAFDLLGHGDSDKPIMGYSATKQAQILVQALDALGIYDAVFIGHSLSGTIAGQIAVDYPDYVNKLIFYDTPIPIGTWANISSLLRTVPLSALLPVAPLAIPGSAIMAAVLPKRRVIGFTLDQWKVPYPPTKRTPEFMDQPVRVSWHALSGNIRGLFLFHRLPLEKIAVPTLIIVGEHDVLVTPQTARRYQSLIPNAQLEVLDDAGHVSLLDQPEAFNSSLDKFLSTGLQL